MVSCPPLASGPTRIWDSSPHDVRDTMAVDDALSIATGRGDGESKDILIPH
jgi:hypothetical protein